jgi:hypothetical protein
MIHALKFLKKKLPNLYAREILLLQDLCVVRWKTSRLTTLGLSPHPVEVPM